MTEANKKKIDEEIAVSNQIRDNAIEWEKTKSISLATTTMELLIKLYEMTSDEEKK